MTKIFFVLEDSGKIVETDLTYVPSTGDLVNFWSEDPPRSAWRVRLVSWHWHSMPESNENHVHVFLQ